MNRILRARLLAASALLALSALAQAQYMWIDEKGIKQFSDRAPPASVPLTAILKAPRGAASAATMPTATVATVTTDPAAATTVTKPAPPPPPTVAERNADYRKRVREQLEREHKEQEEHIVKADRDDNCARARLAKQSMASGARIGILDRHGERGFLSDEQRVVESAKIDKVLAGCK